MIREEETEKLRPDVNLIGRRICASDGERRSFIIANLIISLILNIELGELDTETSNQFGIFEVDSISVCNKIDKKFV